MASDERWLRVVPNIELDSECPLDSPVSLAVYPGLSPSSQALGHLPVWQVEGVQSAKIIECFRIWTTVKTDVMEG